MLTNRLRLAILSPTTIGATYYAFFWSMVAFYAPFFNVYLAQLGLTGTQIGLIAAIFPLFALTASPFLSSIADQRGWRLRFVQIGLIGWAIVLVLYRLPAGFWGILLLAFLEAIIRSPIIPIGDSLIAQMSSKHRLNYGGMRLWGSIGFAIVAVVAGLLWQAWSYRPMFLVAAVAIVPCLLISRQLEEGQVVVATTGRSIRILQRDPGLMLIYVGSFLIGIALYSTFVFGGIYVNDLGGTEAHVGLLFGLSAFAEVPVMQTADALMRRWQGPRTLLVSYIIIGLSLLGYALVQSPNALLVVNTFKGIGYGLFFVVNVRFIADRAPAEWTATAQAVFQACLVGLAPLTTTILSGYVYEQAGPSLLFGSMAAVTGMSIALLLWGMHRGWFAPVDWDS